jgi:hypothetical protein
MMLVVKYRQLIFRFCHQFILFATSIFLFWKRPDVLWLRTLFSALIADSSPMMDIIPG